MSEIIEEILEEFPPVEEADKQDVIKRLYVGFANKSKLEHLRFFVI